MLRRSRAVVDIVENKAELLGDRLLIEKPGSDCSNHYSMLHSSAQGSSNGGDAFATIGERRYASTLLQSWKNWNSWPEQGT